MKPKNKIKLHKSVVDVINSATELVNAMIELHKQRFNYKIPYYTKDGIHKSDFEIVSDGQSKEKEKIVLPDGKTVNIKDTKEIIFEGGRSQYKTHLIDSFKFALENGKIWFPKEDEAFLKQLKNFKIGVPDHNKEWSEKLNNILKRNRIIEAEFDFQKGMVDADKELQNMSLKQQQEYQIDKFYDLRGIFSRNTRSEILNNAELKIKGIDVLKKALNDLENS